MSAAALREPVVALVRAAGEAILAIYRTGAVGETRKDDDSPLTAADLAAHRLLTAALGALTPGLPVLSEESGAVPAAERRAWPSYWLVDPLDGTKEFIARNGEFTVNVALVEGHRPVLGVVGVPAQDRIYTGLVGGGADRRDGAGPAQPIATRIPAPSPLRVVGSRSHRGDSLDAFLGRIGPHELVPVGSALKFCLVAEGRADVYPRLGPTSEWDTAAAAAVLVAAGGVVLTLDGRPLGCNTHDGLLNPHFVAAGDPGRDWAALVRG